MAKHFTFPNFATSVPGKLRWVLENDTKLRDKMSLDGLVMTKFKSGGTSMMLKTVMEVAQDYTVFDYSPPRPQRDLKYKDISIVADPGMKSAPNFFLPGHRKDKVGKKSPPPNALTMDILETS